MSIFRSTSLKRSRLKRKPAKRRPGDVDRAYVAWIKTLPCVVLDCTSNVLSDWARAQHPTATIEAHHAGDHGMSQRPPDRTCLPICVWHHREGPDSVHKLGKTFYDHHGMDRDALIAEHNARYDSEH